MLSHDEKAVAKSESPNFFAGVFATGENPKEDMGCSPLYHIKSVSLAEVSELERPPKCLRKPSAQCEVQLVQLDHVKLYQDKCLCFQTGAPSPLVRSRRAGARRSHLRDSRPRASTGPVLL